MINSLIKKENLYDYFSKFFLFFVFLYALIRALTLSIIHDEAITAIYHAVLPYLDIIKFNGPIPSNNHLLNTILVKFFVSIFGLSEFVVRIPALIGCAFYLVGSYKLLKLFFKKYFLVVGVVLLSLNPFLVDFFSLSRGYSLALGFLMLGLFYFLRWVKNIESENQFKNITLIFVFLGLSVLSNISFLNVYLAISLLFILLELKNIIVKKNQLCCQVFKERFNDFLPIIISSILLFIVLAGPIMKMKGMNEFYFGGESGFWADTVKSLINATLYDASYSNFIGSIINAFVIIFILLFIGYIIYKLYKKNFSKENYYLSLIFIIILLIALSIIFQNILLGTLFVVERAAIYFIPLFLIFVLFLWQSIAKKELKFLKNILNALFIIFTIFLIFHYVISINLSNSYVWRHDSSVKNVMENIYKLSADKGLKNDELKIGASWLLAPSINFYRMKYDMYWLKQVDGDGTDVNFNFYYLLDEDKELIKKHNLVVLNYNKLADSYLAIPAEGAETVKKDFLSKSSLEINKLKYLNQPEIFSTINFIPPVYYNNKSVTLILGVIFVFVALGLIFFKNKLPLLKNYQTNKILLVVIVIFWLPLYAVSLYNNIYDLKENLDIYKFNIQSKRVVRFCNMGFYQGAGDVACKFLSFTTLIKNSLPHNSSYKFLTLPGFETNFNYFLYPDFVPAKSFSDADFVLLYYPPDYYYDTNKLYQRIINNNQPESVEIGKYDLVGSMGDGILILKK